MTSRILSDENYMNDALSSIYSNLILGLKRKEERSIWGPAEISPCKGKSSSVSYRSYFTESELVNRDDVNKLPLTTKPIIHPDFSKSGDFNTVNSSKTKVCHVNSTEELKNEFDNWCEIRKRDKVCHVNSTELKNEFDNRCEIRKRDKVYHVHSTEEVKSEFDNLSEIGKKGKMSQSSLNQSDDTNPTVINTEVKDILSRRSVINKNKREEVLPKFKEENIYEDVKNNDYLFKRKELSLEQKKSSKSNVFTAEDDRNKCQSWHRNEKKCNLELSQKQRPKFTNKYDKRRDRSKKQFVSIDSLSKNEVFNDSKEKIFRVKKENMSTHNSSECVFNSSDDQCFTSKIDPQLCTIQITDKNGDKNYKITVDSVKVSGLKRTLPKLSADIPEVDSACKEIKYSVDAMNLILRYVFRRERDVFKNALPPPAIGVEVIAAAQSWDINEFSKLFQEKFLQNVLKSNNNDISLVYSHASHYNLKDICDACKNIPLDKTVLNTNAHKKRQKTCLVSVFTHVEPMEISIPFEPIEKDIISKDLTLSLKPNIQNTFIFKAVSGCFSIIGFRVQLNEKYVSEKSKTMKDRKISIDYSIINKGNYQVIENDTVEKPFRAVIAIDFKKPLILNPNEVGEIVIETDDIESFLCSAFIEKKILVKKNVGELDLIMESTRKIDNSDRKLFFVGNFLYHVKKGT